MDEPTPRRRARDLGIRIGRFDPGPHNALTDVFGVQVGHCTLFEGDGELRVGYGPVRTGVTAILPSAGNVFMERVVGSGFVLNGAGEVSGLTQVMEWGLIETPILLTSTLSVGACSSALVEYMVERHPGIGAWHDVIIPVVGECDDSWLSDAAGRHLGPEQVRGAIEAARAGPVEEGNVGGGTGMVTCDFAGGIGTSSRVLPAEAGAYTLGVLVMSNFGRMDDLQVEGFPLGRALLPDYAHLERRLRSYGSIIAVVATDAPLLPHQIGRLCKRVALGIGRAGSYAAHGSGEIVVGFSTANRVPREPTGLTYEMRILHDTQINPLYQAAAEATEEAILNALCAARTIEGHSGHIAPALPLDRVQELFATSGRTVLTR